MATVTATIGTLQSAFTMDTVGASNGDYRVQSTAGTMDSSIGAHHILMQTTGDGAYNYWEIISVANHDPVDCIVADTWSMGTGPAEGEDCVAGRMFTTVTAAEAAISSLASAGDEYRMEVYADATISETIVLINDETLGGSGKITLTAAVGEDHRGWAGWGAHIRKSDTGDGMLVFTIDGNNPAVEVSKLELTAAQTIAAVTCGAVDFYSPSEILVDRLLIYDWATTGSTVRGIGARDNAVITNCAIWDMGKGAGGEAHGIFNLISVSGAKVSGCTVYNCDTSGLAMATGAVKTLVTNTVIANCGESDFYDTYHANSSNNASEDETAPGDDSITGITATDEMLDPANGDLRLQATSQLRRAGLNDTDCGRLDVTGRARKYPFDIGAYAFLQTALWGLRSRLRNRG